MKILDNLIPLVALKIKYSGVGYGVNVGGRHFPKSNNRRVWKICRGGNFFREKRLPLFHVFAKVRMQ